MKANKSSNKKVVSKPKSKTVKTKSNKTTKSKDSVKDKIIPKNKSKLFLMLLMILFLAVLLIISTYAWFSTSLNVKVKTFNMIVTKDSGLTISFDGVNFDSSIAISRDILFEQLTPVYKNHKSQWASNGFVPVSTIGNKSRNSQFFDVYRTGGIKYRNPLLREGAYFYTNYFNQDKPKKFANFIAFDLFFRNDNNESPVADKLYFDYGTGVKMSDTTDELMMGLVYSMRMGIVKIGSVPMNASVDDIQNIKCNNNCDAVIYEPFSTMHTQMSIDAAKEYGINLKNGQPYPTYATIDSFGPLNLENAVSGSTLLDKRYFKYQNTITEADFDKPLFEIPHGITKARFYIWVEGQDIDSLETDSTGTNVDISINFVKDTYGWDEFN